MEREERRRFFRIDDSMGVCYRRLSEEEARAFARRLAEPGGAIDYASHFDNRIQTLLEACRVQNPVAAELLDLLNKKLNFAIQQMEIDAGMLQKIAYQMKQVNVSGCGMAFAVGESFKRGEMLQLDLLLHPGELHVIAMAEVVACESQAEGEWFLRLNFVELNRHDQELLIQHVVKRQSAILKARRQAQQLPD